MAFGTSNACCPRSTRWATTSPFNDESQSEGRNPEHFAPSIIACIKAQEGLAMSNHGEGGKCGGGGGDRGPSSHPGPGGNWPSTTGNPSGGGRDNDDGDDG